jgi:hypothetical protein
MELERIKPPVKSEENKVWVTVTHTVNLGNFENVKFEAGFSETLIPHDDPYKMIDVMCEEILEVIKKQGQIAYKDLGRYSEKTR